jgi:prephenate dehydrogenase
VTAGEPAVPAPADRLAGGVLVVGTGLIGTSIALALSRAGVPTWLDDPDPAALALAAARGAGRPWDGRGVAHAVVAAPPSATVDVLLALQDADAAASYSDVASVKSQLVAEAERRGVSLSTWCPAHPVAGRERGGAGAAQADLFLDRSWVLCPLPVTEDAAVVATQAVAELCGAQPVRLDPARHDAVLASLSHVPQLVASALAVAADALGPAELELAGGGFRDGTRVAASDAALWQEIIAGNRAPVAAALDRVLAELTRVRDALEPAPPVPATRGEAVGEVVGEVVGDLVARGAVVRRGLPDKPAAGRSLGRLVVVVDDRPGALAGVFDAAARQGVNVEDVRVEHALGGRRGQAELLVPAAGLGELGAGLTAAGYVWWPVDDGTD